MTLRARRHRSVPPPSGPIVVLGDVMLDRYLRGSVSRVSPEAPVPVVQLARQADAPGGAANVALNLRRLGLDAWVIGCVGGDPEGERLTELLAREGITRRLVEVPGWDTTLKTRVIGGHQHLLRIDRERPLLPTEVPGERLERALDAALSAAPSAIVVSDYAKGVVTDACCRRVIAEAAKRHVPVIVDPKGHDWERYRGATCVCPNTRELAQVTGASANDPEAQLAAATDLVEQLDLGFVALTRGEHGITVVRREGAVHEPAVAREVFDVSGAGDTVVAVLAMALAAGVEPPEAARMANLAGGVVVGKLGTAPIERAELDAALDRGVGREAAKVVTRAEALARVGSWRDAGERVVFTNGCFDVLHAGHVTCLQRARAQGERLVVALNDDASVRRLKGEGRPVVGEVERAAVIAALECVDLVVGFAEDTPLGLIRELHPDVLVKGDDYRLEDVVGADDVIEWGGRVVLVERVRGFSTTSILSAMGDADADDD